MVHLVALAVEIGREGFLLLGIFCSRDQTHSTTKGIRGFLRRKNWIKLRRNIDAKEMPKRSTATLRETALKVRGLAVTSAQCRTAALPISQTQPLEHCSRILTAKRDCSSASFDVIGLSESQTTNQLQQIKS